MTLTFVGNMKNLVFVFTLFGTLWASAAFGSELDEFGARMSYFYQSPSKEAFEAFQKDAHRLRSELRTNGSGAETLIAVMLARISEMHDWPIRRGGLGARAKEILKGKSDFARYVADDARVDPTKLDIWWASFFATGSERYLELILGYAGLAVPEDDLNKTLIIGAATWSFKSNCSQHAAVLAFAEKSIRLESITEAQRKFLIECLEHAERGG